MAIGKNSNPRAVRAPMQQKRGIFGMEPILLDGELAVTDANQDGHYDQIWVGNKDFTNSSFSFSGPVGPQGPKGDTGATGSTGSPGSAATVAVGTVSTGAAGSSASVTNSGSSSAAVLDFTIPRGNLGAAGTNGTNGASATIAVGTTTTGTPGSSASVSNSGSSSAAVFNFTIPGTLATKTASKAVASISLGTTDVVITWPVAFADNNYICQATIFMNSLITSVVTVVQTAQTASTATFRIVSVALISTGGTLNVLAVHN